MPIIYRSGLGRNLTPDEVDNNFLFLYQQIQALQGGNPTPGNVLPVANAGTSASITLPNNSVVLNGSGTDADGTITAYQWEQIIGPAQATGLPANQAQIVASGLVQGTYQFRLTVTDNSGGKGVSTVQISVLAAGSVGYGTATNITLTEIQRDGSGAKINGLMSCIVPDFGSGRPNCYWRVVTNFGSGTVVANTPYLGTLLYSSLDAINWKPEPGGTIAPPFPSAPLRLMERPAITRLSDGYWYLYAHTAPDPPVGTYDTYNKSQLVVYKSKGQSPNTGWDYLGAVNGMSGGCLDFSIYHQTATGKKFLVSSVNNVHDGSGSTFPLNVRIECAEILAGGMTFGTVRVLDNRGFREAPQIFEHAGKLYFTTCPTDGYKGSEPDYKVGTTLDDLASKANQGGLGIFYASQGFPNNLSAGTVFFSQASSVFQLNGIMDQAGHPATVMVADDWQYNDLANSEYLYYPLHFDQAGNLYAREVNKVWHPNTAWQIPIPANILGSTDTGPLTLQYSVTKTGEDTEKAYFSSKYFFNRVITTPVDTVVEVTNHEGTAVPYGLTLQPGQQEYNYTGFSLRLAGTYNNVQTLRESANGQFVRGAQYANSFSVTGTGVATNNPVVIEAPTGISFSPALGTTPGWKSLTGIPNATNGTIVVLDHDTVPGATADIAFSGDYIDFLSPAYNGSTRVRFQVAVDGVPKGEVNYVATNGDETPTSRLKITGLGAGNHVARVTPVAGCDVYLDRILVAALAQ